MRGDGSLRPRSPLTLHRAARLSKGCALLCRLNWALYRWVLSISQPSWMKAPLGRVGVRMKRLRSMWGLFSFIPSLHQQRDTFVVTPGCVRAVWKCAKITCILAQKRLFNPNIDWPKYTWMVNSAGTHVQIYVDYSIYRLQTSIFDSKIEHFTEKTFSANFR